MDNTNKETLPSTIEPDISESKYGPEKPDFVKKIEAFDINNLTSENIDFMSHTIQDYFLENFPVDTELVNQLPDHISVISNEEFVRINTELGEDPKFSAEHTTGVYCDTIDKILINKNKHKTPGELFTTMFHESLHYVSIGAGAGLSGSFLCPEKYLDDETIESQIDAGINALQEGTTQLITLRSVLGDMGFDEQDGMFSYQPEREIMHAIWMPYSEEKCEKVYFNTSMEELRVHIDKTFEPEETKDRIGPDFSNHTFVDCLINLGTATENMSNALENWETDDGEIEGILKDVRHAIGAYIVRDIKAKNIKLDEEEKVDLYDYFEPYDEEEEDV